MPVVNSIVYKDIDTLFAAHPVTGKLNTLINNAAVARAVKNLVLTNKGERPYQPFIGSDLRRQLFELNDGTVEGEVQQAIEDVIREYEPRAQLIDVFVVQDVDQNRLSCTIKFRVVNQTDPITVNFFLERVR
jgi:phage baseplate assembly protein W